MLVKPFFQAGLAAAILLAAPMAAVADAAPKLPTEAFASLPAFDDPVLSPNGERIAYAIQFKGRTYVIYQNLDGSERKMIPPLDDGEIFSFIWANDTTLLVKYGGTVRRLMFRNKSHETRVIAFDTKENKPRWLGKPKGVTGRPASGQYTSQLEQIVDLLPDDPDHILMAMDFELNAMPEVYRVDVRTGRRTTALRGRSGVLRWYTDQKSDVRLGTGVNDEGPVVVLKGLDDKWHNLDKLDWANNVDIAGFSTDPRYLYVSGKNKFGTTGLYSFDLQSGQVIDRLFEDEKYDAEGFVEHPVTGHLAGVLYRDDFLRVRYLDKDLDILQRSLQKAVPGAMLSIVSKARNRDLYIVLAKSDRNPGDYLIYDRAARNLSFMASRYSNLDTEAMAATVAVEIPVRDGSTIPGYLTLPLGHQTAAGLPAVIMPHGGPIGIRDDAEWDWWAQFLANRGYAVLKPNFRGSGGYGGQFQEAGENQWGGLMQDDVTDATRWLIAVQGADAGRLCIVGASYGGYAALMGAIKEPGLYRCAASVNGVTDLPDLKRFERGFVGGRYWGKIVGLEGAEDRSVSPVDRAEDVSAPVLLIAARDDTVVPFAQSRDMDRRLRKLKKSSRYIEIETGAHWLMTAEARRVVLSELETFLAEHLGGQ